MQMHSLRRELSAGLRPVHETFISLIRLFGSKGYSSRGMEILAAMEKLNYDIRQAWIVLVGTYPSFCFVHRVACAYVYECCILLLECNDFCFLNFRTEELIRNKHLEDANDVFLKGAKGGLRATDELYDLLIQEDCKVGDHSNALEICYEMEAAGRMATTFHFNCLLSVQVCPDS